ncbi:MAG: glycosyltransferase family 1 protein [Acidobacteria bacterium]|nr:MAG: glycosyltransferase family 1 protein [Acidobacteriota bacterium]
MKIARAIARLNIGGPAIQAVLLTRELAEAGHATSLLVGTVPESEGSMEYLADEMGVRLVRIPRLSREVSILSDLRACWDLYRWLRRERPDILHTHTAKAGALGRLAAFASGTPCVHTYHGNVFEGYFSRKKAAVYLLVERLLARGTKRIIAISPRQRDDLAGRFRVAPAARISTVRLGFDLSGFLKVAHGRFAQKNGCHPLVVAWVGRLTAVKDPLMFPKVAALCTGGNAISTFLMVGDGELRAQVEAEKGNLDLGDQLRVTGWQRDMVSIYSLMDILLLTSINEGTPVAAIEAMAAGCPAILPDVGGVADLMSGNPERHSGYSIFDNGILVTRRAPETFAEALSWLASNPQRRERMGRAASVFAQQNFSKERLVHEIEKVYASVLDQGKGRSTGTKGEMQ